MKTNDYYVTASGVIERGTFYNYLINLGYKAYGYNREYMINSSYPFAICINKKKFTVIESATFFIIKKQVG